MTKRKPEKVIEYRISLQDKERELLEHLVYVEGTAKAFNQFTEPFVEILKDISALTVIFSALAGLLMEVCSRTRYRHSWRSDSGFPGAI